MTGVVIIARLGSTRLPRKHLIRVSNGETFIEVLCKRLASALDSEIGNGECKIVLATSDESENREFEEILKGSVVSVFYGNRDNIPLRQLECAEFYGFENIISIDGDDILCSPAAVKAVLHRLTDGNQPMAQTEGLPTGMNVMGYKTSFLDESLGRNRSGLLETGWGRIFEKNRVFTISYPPVADLELRLTLDYEEDARFFKAVIDECGSEIYSIGDTDLIQTVVEKKYHELNSFLTAEYEANIEKQITKEKNNEQ
jgi:spore coat polysaccharide biosynthesis protein SpsF